MLAGLHRELLGRQAEGVEAHRVQHVVADACAGSARRRRCRCSRADDRRAGPHRTGTGTCPGRRSAGGSRPGRSRRTAAPTGFGASKVPSLVPALLPGAARWRRPARRCSGAAGRPRPARRSSRRRPRWCSCVGCSSAFICPDKRRAPADGRGSAALTAGQRGDAKKQASGMHRLKNTPRQTAQRAELGCAGSVDLVHAPRPPSVAAERGGTTQTVEASTTERVAGSLCPRSRRCAAAIRRRRRGASSSSNIAAAHRQRRDDAGHADVVRAQPPQRRRPRVVRARAASSDQWQLASGPSTCTSCGVPSSAAHNAIAVALCVTSTAVATGGQLLEGRQCALGHLRPGLAAAPADVAAGDPVAVLVRVLLLHLVAGQPLPVAERPLAQPRLGSDREAGDGRRSARRSASRATASELTSRSGSSAAISAATS